MKDLKDLKMKNAAEIQKLSKEKIVSEIKDAEKNLYALRMKLAVGEQKQTHLLGALRRYIASLKTRLNSAQ